MWRSRSQQYPAVCHDLCERYWIWTPGGTFALAVWTLPMTSMIPSNNSIFKGTVVVSNRTFLKKINIFCPLYKLPIRTTIYITKFETLSRDTVPLNLTPQPASLCNFEEDFSPAALLGQNPASLYRQSVWHPGAQKRSFLGPHSTLTHRLGAAFFSLSKAGGD